MFLFLQTNKAFADVDEPVLCSLHLPSSMKKLLHSSAVAGAVGSVGLKGNLRHKNSHDKCCFTTVLYTGATGAPGINSNPS